MLKTSEVSYHIAGRQILKDISLTLRPGVTSVVLGPNGAGKSTLLKLLAGALKPQSGRICAGDIPIEKWESNALSRRRAVLSQESQLAFNFNVLEVVLMGRLPHHSGWESRRDREIAVEALDAVDAAELASRTYLTLSGGERQRVNLARTLAQIWDVPTDGTVCSERCLLLDEPINNLDLQHQHSTLRVARRFAREGVAVLAVLHDLNLALEYADELILIHNGGACSISTADGASLAKLLTEVYQWPLGVGTNPYTKTIHVFSSEGLTTPG